MKPKHFLLAFLLIASAVARAQIVNEELLPKLPWPQVSAGVVAAPNGFYLSGSTSITTPYFDGWNSSSIPFFLLHPESSQKTIVLLPDTGQSSSYPFRYDGDEFAMSSVLTRNDSFFVSWSKIMHLYSDIPPIYHSRPLATVGKLRNGKIEKILSLPNGLNPSMVIDSLSNLHLLWEKVTPFPKPSGNIFSAYSSTILYRALDQYGNTLDSAELGKGFFPRIIQDRSTLHCLYYQADSSTQLTLQLVYRKIAAGVLQPPVTLYDIRLPETHWPGAVPSGGWLNRLAWGIDVKGGVHIGWKSTYDPGKVFVLHYGRRDEIQIDSTEAFYFVRPTFRFMPDGEARIFAVTQNSYSDIARLRYFLSKPGTPLTEDQVIQLYSNSSFLSQVLIDKSGRQHALIIEWVSPPSTYLLRNIGTADTSKAFVTSSYNVGSSAYIDTAQRVWTTGTRDSTTVLLNFRLEDVGKAEDFAFPLVPGNRWYYTVYNIENPDPFTSFIGYDSVSVEGDTLCPNGKRYARLKSRMFPVQYLRKDGFGVYQYSPKDGAEYLRFNFAAHEGDTIAFYGNSSPTHFSILRFIQSRQLFGLDRRVQSYWGIVPGSRSVQTSVADGFGMLSESDGLSTQTWLVAAKINGIVYGRVPGTPGFYFPIAVGNEWYYLTYAEPPNSAWPEESIVKSVGDTVMPNGKHYAKIASKKFGTVYWRTAELDVFQYSPGDTSEFVRFNFSKAARETIAVKVVDGKRRSIVIDSIYMRSVVKRTLLTFRFVGDIENDYYGRMGVDVSDSIGLTDFGLIGPESFLIGAKIDGKTYGTVLSVHPEPSALPREYSLSQNYPNPFNPSTTFRFAIPEPQIVELTLFNILGREVVTLVNQRLDAGTYSVLWDASRFSSGVYFYRMKAGSFVQTGKAVLVR